MKIRKLICMSLFGIFAASCVNDSQPLYKNSAADLEDRVEDLLSRMTLEEKIWQISQGHLGRNDNPNNVVKSATVPPMIGSMINYSDDSRVANAFQKFAVDSSRLGIPVIFGYDVIHGFKTSFPIPLAQAASFNTELARRAATIAAHEAYAGGIHWTFSPMIDIARDPRWGRVMEGYGEDPVVTSAFCEAVVKGYQGETHGTPGHIAACLKHYVGYGASDGGRDYAQVDMSHQTLWDTYLPPFEAGVKAGAMTVMGAFNTLNGVPASANHYTLTEVLKNKWGFDGFVVSDWGSVEQIVLQGVAADTPEAAAMAINSGIDMDMCDFAYAHHLDSLVRCGVVKEKTVDEAVRRVLRVKFRLGLFENPYFPETSSDDFLKEEYLLTAEQMAVESMVLLKNNGVLPLKKETKVSVIGNLAVNGHIQIGTWRARADTMAAVTVYEGISEVMKCTSVKDADVLVVCIGENGFWTGENKTRADISLPEGQLDFLRKAHATGKPVVTVLVSGRPLDLREVTEKSDAILYAWSPGHMGGKAIAGIITGKYNPSGRLPMSFPYSVGQIPIYYNHRDRARRGSWGEYIDGTPLTPLYDFGFGLSYSAFKYSEISLDGLTAKVTVTNTSSIDGQETVLWYIKDKSCSIARPVKELIHFEKRLVKAGQTEEFSLTMNQLTHLGFVDDSGKRFFEPGDFVIMTGDKSLDFRRDKNEIVCDNS